MVGMAGDAVGSEGDDGVGSDLVDHGGDSGDAVVIGVRPAAAVREAEQAGLRDTDGGEAARNSRSRWAARRAGGHSAGSSVPCSPSVAVRQTTRPPARMTRRMSPALR